MSTDKGDTASQTGSRAWYTSANFFVSVAAFVLTVGAIVVTVQLAQVSSLSDDIRSTSQRIDQIYPVLTAQAGDIGSIKGDLKVAADKLVLASEKFVELSSRLEAASKAQLELTASVEKLSQVVQASFKKLDDIEDKLDQLSRDSQLKKTDYLDGMYVFSSETASLPAIKTLMSSGVQVIAVDSSDDLFSKFEEFKGINPDNVWIGTWDEKTGLALQEMFKGGPPTPPKE